jgi:uncharacterized protein (TIGR02145 family)
LAENYAYLPYFQEPGNSNAEAWVYGYKGNDIAEAKANSNYEKYGVLYTADMMFAEDFVPEGWRIAGDDDWAKLEKFAGMTSIQISKAGTTSDRGTKAGAKFRANSFGNGKDIFKLNINGGGLKDSYGFKSSSLKLYFWMKPFFASDLDEARYRYFNSMSDGIGYNGNLSRYYGMYLRLVKK